MFASFRSPAIALAAGLIGLALAVVSAAAQQAQPPLKQFGPRINPPAGAAQPNRAAPPAPDVIAKHGDWVVQCDKKSPTGEPAAEKTCGMVQTVRNAERNVPLTLVIVAGKQDGKDVYMMRVLAPIGVFLPTGVALEIDGAAVGRVPFTRCLPQTCMAFAEASPPTLEKMKKGNSAKFIIYEAPGLGIDMSMSLSGFTAAIAELGKL